METLAALFRIRMLEKIDEFRLSGCRPADDNEYGKVVHVRYSFSGNWFFVIGG